MKGELCLAGDENIVWAFLGHCSGNLSGNQVIEYCNYSIGGSWPLTPSGSST